MDSMHASLALLFGELIDGPSPDAAYMLNPGDPGLLRSLTPLASPHRSRRAGAATIAAHVDHLLFWPRADAALEQGRG